MRRATRLSERAQIAAQALERSATQLVLTEAKFGDKANAESLKLLTAIRVDSAAGIVEDDLDAECVRHVPKIRQTSVARNGLSRLFLARLSERCGGLCT